MTKPYFTSKSDEWATPQDLYDSLDAEFHFNLDPCSTDINCKCEKHFTPEQDGLKQNWGGAECSATHRIAESQSGRRSVTEKVTKTIRW